jgi:hypothetical protein
MAPREESRSPGAFLQLLLGCVHVCGGVSVPHENSEPDPHPMGASIATELA